MSSNFRYQGEKLISHNEEKLPTCWIPREIASSRSNDLIDQKDLVWATDGKLLLNKIIYAIASAKEVICVSSFLIADKDFLQAIIDASSRDIRVYLLTASETILQKEIRGESEFDSQRLKEHEQTLDDLAGKVLVRTADNLHAKFIVLDPNSSSPKGMILTANITTEALTRNPELAVSLTETESHDLFRIFIRAFWKESQHELLEPGRLRKVKSEPRLSLPSPNLLPYTMKDSQTLKKELFSLLDKARSEIWITSYGIEQNHEILVKLIEKIKKDIKIHFLTRKTRKKPSHMEALQSLANAGAEIRGYDWLHAKGIVVDTKEGLEGIIMTANMEQRGLDEGFEVGVILKGDRASSLKKILRQWWERAPCQFTATAKIGEVKGSITLWENNTLSNANVEERFETDLGEMEAASLEEAKRISPTNLPSPKTKGTRTYYHEHVYKWVVIPKKETLPNRRSDEKK